MCRAPRILNADLGFPGAPLLPRVPSRRGRRANIHRPSRQPTIVALSLPACEKLARAARKRLLFPASDAPFQTLSLSPTASFEMLLPARAPAAARSIVLVSTVLFLVGPSRFASPSFRLLGLFLLRHVPAANLSHAAPVGSLHAPTRHPSPFLLRCTRPAVSSAFAPRGPGEGSREGRACISVMMQL